MFTLAVFIALMLMRTSKCLKQIIQIKLNRESQLAEGKTVGYLQAWWRIWTWDYHEQIQLAVKAGLDLGTSELQVQHFNHSANLSPGLNFRA